MMAIAIWGTKANGGAYAAIASLTNILTACLSLVFYEAVFVDSSRGMGLFGLFLKILTLTPTFPQLFLQITTCTCALRRLSLSTAPENPPSSRYLVRMIQSQFNHLFVDLVRKPPRLWCPARRSLSMYALNEKKFTFFTAG